MAEPTSNPLWSPRYWPSALGFALLRMLSWFPLPVLSLLGYGAGMLFYVLHAPRRRIVRANIQRCFPELSPSEQGRLVRRHFRCFGQTVFDLPVAWWGSRRRLVRLVRLRDVHHLANARAAGRNVILLVPHFVGLEMGGIRLSIDTPVLDVFRHPKNKVLRWIMERRRTRFGAVIVEHNKPMTTLVRTLKGGTPFYYLPDQNAPRRQAVFAPFFGVSAATFPTLSRLARMADAVVIPCSTYQRSWGRGYEIVFSAPLDNFPSDDVLADVTRMNAQVERAVRLHPEQYFWVHRRFKTRPKGEPKLYAKDKKEKNRKKKRSVGT
jgi:KDO2-lipid IV(A) lauroyltransferase